MFDRADRRFDEAGEVVDDGFFYKDEAALYAEYGLTPRFTLVGRFAWQTVRRRTGADREAAEGFSATEIGGRWLAWQSGRDAVSAQLVVLVPGAGENVSNRPLGSGDAAVDLRALWGRSLGEHVFAEGQAAWRWRDGADLDEARLDLTLGWRPDDRWSVMVQSLSVWSVEPPAPGRGRFDQHRLQLSAGRRIGRAEYHVGGYVTPAGRNAIIERAVFLSVWRRF